MISAGRTILVALGLVFLAMSGAQAQTIQGRLLDEGTGNPIEGALVRLMDASGEVIDGYLTNRSGRFVLSAHGPGPYRAVAERIGYRTTESDSLNPAPGDVIELLLHTAFAPIPLDAIEVEGEKNCVVRPAEGAILERLWGEARKVLVAQEWSTSDRTYPFSILRYTRTLDERGMGIESEDHQRRTVVAPTAIRSRAAADLLTNGFVQKKDSEDPIYEYYGPDADVLLSDAFLDTHCLRIAGEDKETGHFGIGFEPVRSNGPPDIEGTFWLHPEDAHLTALDFRYTWSPAPEAKGHARGRIGFEELPNGGWIIQEWWIRTPILEQRYAAGHGIRNRIVGFSEEGEEITRLTASGAPNNQHPRGSVTGLVWDSLRARPLEGATVYLSGTQHHTETGPNGRFELFDIREGKYSLAFTHPELDSLGIIVPGTEVEIREASSTEAFLAVPTLETVLTGMCPGNEGPGAFLTGVVTDPETDRPLPGAGVSIVWTDYDIPGGNEIRGTRQSIEATTDSRGRYRACGITPGAEVATMASLTGCSGPLEKAVAAAGVINQAHLTVDPDRCGSTEAQVLACPTGGLHPGLGALGGMVADAATNVPVGLVEIRIVRLKKDPRAPDPSESPEQTSVRADAAGRFQICPMEPGRYRVSTSVPEVGDASVEIEVPPNQLAHLTLGLVEARSESGPGTILGRVVTADGGDPIPGAEVILVDADRRQVADARGSFRFLDVAPGSHTLRATHLSFGEAEGGLVLGAGRTLEVAVQLSPDPIGLEPIIVEANRSELNIFLADIRRRAARGLGTVLLSEDLDHRRTAGRTTDLLFEHGAYVIGATPSQRAVYLSRTPSCAPTVYIDGIRVVKGGGRKFGGSDGGTEVAQAIDLVHPIELEAMEIYRGPAETPGEFIDSNSQCGVILLWTKRGGG